MTPIAHTSTGRRVVFRPVGRYIDQPNPLDPLVLDWNDPVEVDSPYSSCPEYRIPSDYSSWMDKSWRIGPSKDSPSSSR